MEVRSQEVVSGGRRKRSENILVQYGKKSDTISN